MLDIPYLLSIHNVLNVPPTGKNQVERDLGFEVAGGESCARAGEEVTLEQLRYCLSVLISARQYVEGSPEGSICVVVCRTEIGCRSAA